MTQQEQPVPIDHADLERSSLGDREFERELLAEFLGSSSGTLATLAGALATRDVQAVHHAAHSLKGCCWTIGAKAMGSACESLEMEARGGRLDGAEGMVARIHDQFARLEAYVRRHWGL